MFYLNMNEYLMFLGLMQIPIVVETFKCNYYVDHDKDNDRALPKLPFHAKTHR